MPGTFCKWGFALEPYGRVSCWTSCWTSCLTLCWMRSLHTLPVLQRSFWIATTVFTHSLWSHFRFWKGFSLLNCPPVLSARPEERHFAHLSKSYSSGVWVSTWNFQKDRMAVAIRSNNLQAITYCWLITNKALCTRSLTRMAAEGPRMLLLLNLAVW